MSNKQTMKERFDKEFGKFYIKAHDKSRTFWASMGGLENKGEVDFEAGETIAIGSENIKAFINSEQSRLLTAMLEKTNNGQSYIDKEDILAVAKEWGVEI